MGQRGPTRSILNSNNSSFIHLSVLKYTYLYRWFISVHCPSDFTFCITVRLSSTMFNSQSDRIFRRNGQCTFSSPITTSVKNPL